MMIKPGPNQIIIPTRTTDDGEMPARERAARVMDALVRGRYKSRPVQHNTAEELASVYRKPRLGFPITRA